MSAAILRIALDMPLRRLFDYLPPQAAAPAGEIGQRVRVPFGRQRLVGLVMEQAESSDLPTNLLRAEFTQHFHAMLACAARLGISRSEIRQLLVEEQPDPTLNSSGESTP